MRAWWGVVSAHAAGLTSDARAAVGAANVSSATAPNKDGSRDGIIVTAILPRLCFDRRISASYRLQPSVACHDLRVRMVQLVRAPQRILLPAYRSAPCSYARRPANYLGARLRGILLMRAQESLRSSFRYSPRQLNCM